MDKDLIKISLEDSYFIGAVQQEVFNRILPSIRHDLVGLLSASLMRVSILDKHLNKVEISSDVLKVELSKIDKQLRSGIKEIRDLNFWDFETVQNDFPKEILIKSVQLVSSQLTMRNIQINLIPYQEELEKVEAKPFLFCMLCLLGYIEDNNFDNSVLNITQYEKSIVITSKKKTDPISAIFTRIRELNINQEILVKFAKLHLINIDFEDQKIIIAW